MTPQNPILDDRLTALAPGSNRCIVVKQVSDPRIRRLTMMYVS